MKTSDIENPTNLACLKIAPKREKNSLSVTSEKAYIHISSKNFISHLFGFVVWLRISSSL